MSRLQSSGFRRGMSKDREGFGSVSVESVARPVSHLCMSLFIFFVVARPLEVLEINQPVPIGNILILLAVTFLIFRREPWDALPIKVAGIGRLAIVFFLIMVGSLAFSVWKSHSLDFIISRMPVLVFVFVMVACTSSSLTACTRYIRVVGWSTLFLSISLLGSYTSGRAQVAGAYDPNDVAMHMVIGLPILFWIMLQFKGVKRWAVLLGLLAQATAILITQSRGGMLGLLVAVGVLILAARSTGVFDSLSKKVLLAFAIAVAGVVLWTMLPDEARQRLDLFSLSGDYNVVGEDPRGRLNVWRNLLSLIASTPWGIGIDNVGEVMWIQFGTLVTAHNSVIQVTAELGLIGGLVFLMLWARLYGVNDSIQKLGMLRDEQERRTILHLAWAWKSMVAGLVTCSMFLSQGYAYVLFILLGVGAALAAHTRHQLVAEAGVRTGRPSVGVNSPALRLKDGSP